ncbi:MAG TPA: hypothetical protein VLJ17_24685 [Xanthobacteraceae bacterium]|nr:hypothetical protein [Xanthobacteraceae bacterium]
MFAAVLCLTLAIVVLGACVLGLSMRLQRLEDVFARALNHWPPGNGSLSGQQQARMIEDLDAENWGNISKAERDRIRMRMPND